jgi:hypothetical protein
MKIKEHEDYILVFFSRQEEKSGLINHLLKKLPIFGIEYSSSKTIWKVAIRNVDAIITTD